MKSHLHIVEPTPNSCPFRVEAIQYFPAVPCDDGLTLVFLHAMSLHKETFEPMLTHILGPDPGGKIQDVWCIGSAAEYCRAAHAFLTATSHGVDFSTRRIIGLAHSSAVAALMLLQRASPKVRFSGLILLDPALLPPQFPSTAVLSDMFGKWGMTKRERWPSRAAAHAYLAVHPAFKAWDARALQLFVDHALRDADGGVTLACSRAQEVAFYLSPTADYKAVPVQIFEELARENVLPMHLITCLRDEYKGYTTPSKEFQIAQVNSTTVGSVQVLEKSGHMFPQVQPALCADAIRRALCDLGERKARL